MLQISFEVTVFTLNWSFFKGRFLRVLLKILTINSNLIKRRAFRGNLFDRFKARALVHCNKSNLMFRSYANKNGF